MKSATVANWIQTLTGLAVVVGLGLVIWELQQGHEAVSSDLSSDYFQMQNQSFTAILGDNAPEVIAKSCTAPETLTHSDLVILNHYYQDLINSVVRAKTLSVRGRFYTDQTWRNQIGSLSLMLNTAPGVGYWKTIARNWVDPEVLSVGDEFLSNHLPSCSENYADWATESSKLQRLDPHQLSHTDDG